MGQLDGKVAIVTGAARGQGEAEASLFAAEGAKVVVTDVLTKEGSQVAGEIGANAVFVEHDVSSEKAWGAVVDRALSSFGRVDILVNNAEIAPPGKLETTEPALFDEIYRVNQLGVFLGMRAVIKPMKDQGGGAIVNISSVAGLQGSMNLFAYATTKWAVRGMTRCAALELARYKIRVNAIFPGLIDTPILEGIEPRMRDVMLQSTPMRRMGQPREIAEAALFLVSPASSFATGAEFAIDGGMSI
jgi:3alpha(or 20beta)-hydroxysteroid dehydrogenase